MVSSDPASPTPVTASITKRPPATTSTSASPPSTTPAFVDRVTAVAVLFVVTNPPSVMSPPSPAPPTVVRVIVPLPASITAPSVITMSSSLFPLALSAFALTATFPAPEAVMSPTAANVIESSAFSVIPPSSVLIPSLTVMSLSAPVAVRVTAPSSTAMTVASLRSRLSTTVIVPAAVTSMSPLLGAPAGEACTILLIKSPSVSSMLMFPLVVLSMSIAATFVSMSPAEPTPFTASITSVASDA